MASALANFFYTGRHRSPRAKILSGRIHRWHPPHITYSSAISNNPSLLLFSTHVVRNHEKEKEGWRGKEGGGWGEVGRGVCRKRMAYDIAVVNFGGSAHESRNGGIRLPVPSVLVHLMHHGSVLEHLVSHHAFRLAPLSCGAALCPGLRHVRRGHTF